MPIRSPFLIRYAALLALALSAGAVTAAAPGPSDIQPVSPAMRAAMTGTAWKPGCPVPLSDLDAVRVPYWGFDAAHQGTLVVHKRFAADVDHIFRDLYAVHFPINKIAPWEQYGPDVYAERNITVGFYCEKADDAPTEWSSHA